MFTKWLLLRHIEQGHSVRDLARVAGVGEVDIQRILTASGQCGRCTRDQVERALTGVMPLPTAFKT